MIRSVLSVSVLLGCLLVVEFHWNADSEPSSSGLALQTSAPVRQSSLSNECPGAPAHPATIIGMQTTGFENGILSDARHSIMVCSAESSSRKGEARQAHEVESTSGSQAQTSEFLSFVGVDSDDQTKAEPSDSSKPEETPKPKDTPQLSPEMAALRAKVHRALDIYRHAYLNTQQHSPWEIMHSLIAWGVDTQIRQGGSSGKPVTAIGWLCFNGRGNGLNLFYLSGDGLAARNGPGLQGHDGQFMAMLAQSRVKMDYPLKVSGKDFTVADLIKYEQKTCRSRTELTFKLIGLMHYLDSDTTWKNESGQDWSIPKLISEEISQPIRGATCGGTHRLYSLSYAVQKRAKRGEPIDGEYRRAAKYILDYQVYTFKLQNSDGSFSTEWFRGRGNRQDVQRKMQTSGHILELMAYSLPQDKLTSPRMLKAVDYLAGILINGQQRRWKVGPLGHALHSLVIYDSRVFGSQAAERPSQIAQETAFRVARKKAKTPGPVTNPAQPSPSQTLPAEGPVLTQP